MWSIAFPGFGGQLLNRKYIKSVLLVALELIEPFGFRLNIIFYE